MMRVLLLIGSILFASTVVADMPIQKPTVIMDRCGCWRMLRPSVVVPKKVRRVIGTSFQFRVYPSIDSNRFPRFQSWTSM